MTARDLLAKEGKLEADVVAARVGGSLVDLHTPLPPEVWVSPTHPPAAPAEPVRAGDPDALAVIRHSSAHVMADAVQRLFPGSRVAFGPAIDTGFYYDIDRPDGSFSEDDLRRIERKMEEIIAADHPFVREEVSRDDARRILEQKKESFKLEHLERLEGPISIYRHGDWIDLCEGPHVPSTRFLRAFKLTSVAGAYWRGDERNPMLQRIYGTAFASPEELEAYLKQLEEARARDHRKLGKELELVGFHPWAPASPFFLPRGAAVYNGCVNYIRQLYHRHGYQEVVTPQVYDAELFHTSGHLPNFAEGMFHAAGMEQLEKAAESLIKEPARDAMEGASRIRQSMRYGVKSMNCPGHCLLFGLRRRSYRELPFRMADFGRLHRYERSGVTQGLTRVRTFSQDDAHIFCTHDQIPDEIARFIDLVFDVYGDFGFKDVRLVVATRPDDRLGTDEMWDRAEQALMEGCRKKGLAFDVADGEGAHYGPKIEFHLKDAIGRPWQLGTIQVDFNLPKRFELSYIGEDNAFHEPAMLHRAILGSVERFMGVLIEHCGGAFPTWLAPEQVIVLTVSEKFEGWAREALAALRAAGIRAEADLGSEKLGAKIRQARLMRIPYLGVVGQKEVDGRGLAVRSRDEDRDLGLIELSAFIDRLKQEGLPPSARTR